MNYDKLAELISSAPSINEDETLHLGWYIRLTDNDVLKIRIAEDFGLTLFYRIDIREEIIEYHRRNGYESIFKARLLPIWFMKLINQKINHDKRHTRYLTELTNMKFYAKQNDGRLDIREKRTLTKYLRKQGVKPLVVEIKPERGKRTTEANAYYWGVVVHLIRKQLESDWGHHVDQEQVHEILKHQFASSEKLIGMDKVIRLPESTSDMDVRDFWEYVEKCRFWAADTLNVQIPSSDAQE